MKKTIKKHISNEKLLVQTDTVEKHFNLIVNNKCTIDNEYSKITISDLPEWFDNVLFERGQNYLRRNLLGIFTAYLFGLIAVFLIPTISKILKSTHRSSTPCMAFGRYFETFLHIYNLGMNNVMDPKSEFYKSINVIRWKHSVASKRLEDHMSKGISQKDMVLTQFAFVGYVLTDPEKTSLTNDPLERQGFNHFWRVIDRLLGIPDKLNVCRRNEAETTQLFKKIKDNIFAMELQHPTFDFMDLITATVDGIKAIDPLLDIDAILVRFYELHNEKYDKELSLKSRLLLGCRDLIFYLIQVPIIGRIVRNYWNIILRINYWILERCPILAWIKFGKQNSKRMEVTSNI